MTPPTGTPKKNQILRSRRFEQLSSGKEKIFGTRKGGLADSLS